MTKPKKQSRFFNNFSKYRKPIIMLWGSFVSIFFAMFLYIYIVSINLWGLFGELPSSKVLENPDSDLSSELYSADGKLLGKYFRLNRSSIVYNEISLNVVNALFAAEDWRFKEHSGIDLKSLFRVFLLSIVLRKHKGGGSTLSQQLAKNLFNTRSDKYKGLLGRIPIIRTIIIKTKEWIVAVKLEKAYTKNEIVSMYLNTVSFGSNTFGLKSAAKTFFSTTPNELSVEQSALLIGLLKAPTKYSPIFHPDASIKRRNVILSQMYKKNFLNKEEYEKAKSLGINLNYKLENHKSGIATYFRAQVCKYLLKWTKEHGYDLYGDGLKIYTTLDSKLQIHAEEAVIEHMAELQEKFYNHWGQDNPWLDEDGQEIEDFLKNAAKLTPLYKQLLKEYGEDEESVNRVMNTPRMTKIFTWEGPVVVNMSPMEEIAYNKKLLRSGFMALDPHTGHIKAWVGGINFDFFQYDHVLQGKRQAGSAFKPIVYATALDNGFSPHDKVSDVPITFYLPGTKSGTWTPSNWHKTYTGNKMTLRQAMARSINSVTAYLMKKLGPKLVVQYAKKLGIKSHLDPVPALCLGTSDVSLYELIGAYNTFANKGVWTNPFFITRIEDKYGNIIKEFSPLKNEAINEKTAYMMLYMLRGAQEEWGGSARTLNKFLLEDNEIASKTGTTDNHSDGWFIGLTHNLVAGSWVGGDDRCIHFRNMRRGQAGRTARPIWEKFMIKVYEDEEINYPKGKFPKPDKHLEMDEYVKKETKPKDDDDEQNLEEIVEKPKTKLDISQIY